MLTLKSLTFNNIGRFVEEQTIDFTQLGSLVQVNAQNLNTGGSSGAGKSTIFKALEFLLGLNDISNGVLQSRLTKDPMSVTGIFDLDGLPLKIQRDKKLSIDLNSEVTTGSSKITEEKLDNIIGMPRDLFRKILHKRQGEGGFFLEFSPSEVHKFLTSCLGLEKEQEKIIVLDARLVELEKSHNLAWNGLESNNKGLEATKEAIVILGPPPVLEIDPEAIEELKKSYHYTTQRLELLRMGQKIEVDDLEKSRPQIESIPFDRSGIKALENEINSILATISELEKAEQSRQSAIKTRIFELQFEINSLNDAERARQRQVEQKISDNNFEKIHSLATFNLGERSKVDGANLLEELKKIRSSICPTCEQNWTTANAKNKEEDILQKLQVYKKTVLEGAEAKKRLLNYEEESQKLKLELQPKTAPELLAISDQISQLKLESLPQAIPEAMELKLTVDFKNDLLKDFRKRENDHQYKEYARGQEILSEFVKKQSEMRKEHQSILQSVQDEESKTFRKLSDAQYRVKAFEDTKSRFESTLTKLNSQCSQYSSDADAMGLQLTQIKEEIELATESKKVIKSYLSASFEDALDSIGNSATKLIRSIPNMETATIQFEGLKETKEGKVKEEVTCIVSMDGEIGIPVKSLSGGERSSTDLAIDLSVIKFIEERTGKGISLMVLDEPFTGLDSKNILEALEMLKECSIDKQLLIVDHNPEASQSINNRLTVVRDGLTSKIAQQ